MNDRTGQVAIVTGASLGVGLATTKALATRGLNIVAAARDLSRLEAAIMGLGPEIRHRVKGVACDVRRSPRSRHWLMLPSSISAASTSSTTVPA